MVKSRQSLGRDLDRDWWFGNSWRLRGSRDRDKQEDGA
jgi:hypothetical protein